MPVPITHGEARVSLSLEGGGILVEKTPPNSLPGQTLSTAALEKELSVPRRHHPARLSWLGRRCQESRILLNHPLHRSPLPQGNPTVAAAPNPVRKSASPEKARTALASCSRLCSTELCCHRPGTHQLSTPTPAPTSPGALPWGGTHIDPLNPTIPGERGSKACACLGKGLRVWGGVDGKRC